MHHLAPPTYTVSSYGYHSATAVVALALGTGEIRWLEIVLVEDNHIWRFSSFAPVPVTDLAVITTGPYTVAAGQSLSVSATSRNPTGGNLTYAWDLDNNGSYETSGQSATFSAAGITGPASRTIAVKVTSSTGATAIGQTTVTITAPVATPAQVLRPILECVRDNGNGTYTAYFGYKSDWNAPLSVPIGANNKFTPNPQDRGQPTTFQPGRTAFYPNAAFSVLFDGNNLVWSLKSPDGSTRTSTASRNATRCP